MSLTQNKPPHLLFQGIEIEATPPLKKEELNKKMTINSLTKISN